MQENTINIESSHISNSNKITYLVIIAGGNGTRLGLKDIPKPMAEIAGKPLLEHQIELAKQYGCNEIFILSGYKADVIEDYKTIRKELKNYDAILALSVKYLDKANNAANKQRQIQATGGVKRALEAVYDTFDKLAKIYPMKKSELQHNGDIYYNNGNNGTDGDWIDNNHISNMVIYDKKDNPIYSVTVYKDGDVKGFIDALDYRKTRVTKKISESDALDLAACLYQNSDEKGYLDWFSEIKFNTPIKNSSYDALNEVEEEEYEEDEEEMWGKRTKIPRKAPQTMRRRTQHKKSQPPFKLNVRKMF